ncbi:metallophosphoesterase, partial [Enterococcus faecium]
PPMTKFVKHFGPNSIGRDFAVGDIHGCFSRLNSALNTIEFDPSKDRLFSVGDLVDRGPECHLILEWLEMCYSLFQTILRSTVTLLEH